MTWKHTLTHNHYDNQLKIQERWNEDRFQGLEITSVVVYREPLLFHLPFSVWRHDIVVLQTKKCWLALEKFNTEIVLSCSEHENLCLDKFLARKKNTVALKKLKLDSPVRAGITVHELLQWLNMNQLPRSYHWWSANCQLFVDEASQFLTGKRPHSELFNVYSNIFLYLSTFSRSTLMFCMTICQCPDFFKTVVCDAFDVIATDEFHKVSGKPVTLDAITATLLTVSESEVNHQNVVGSQVIMFLGQYMSFYGLTLFFFQWSWLDSLNNLCLLKAFIFVIGIAMKLVQQKIHDRTSAIAAKILTPDRKIDESDRQINFVDWISAKSRSEIQEFKNGDYFVKSKYFREFNSMVGSGEIKLKEVPPPPQAKRKPSSSFFIFLLMENWCIEYDGNSRYWNMYKVSFCLVMYSIVYVAIVFHTLNFFIPYLTSIIGIDVRSFDLVDDSNLTSSANNDSIGTCQVTLDLI